MCDGTLLFCVYFCASAYVRVLCLALSHAGAGWFDDCVVEARTRCGASGLGPEAHRRVNQLDEKPMCIHSIAGMALSATLNTPPSCIPQHPHASTREVCVWGRNSWLHSYMRLLPPLRSLLASRFARHIHLVS